MGELWWNVPERLAWLLIVIRLLSLFLAIWTSLLATGAPRPNIVYLMADDLGYGDVKCFGGERCKIATPHFDRLAREGMRFTDAHPVASVCVPSRMAIMTGRYPWRFVPPRPSGPWGYLNPRLRKDQFTLGRMMRKAGYRTSYVGKWHLGTLMVTTDGKNQMETNVDFTVPMKIGPRDYGFDESFVLPGSLDMYPYVFARNNRWVGKVTKTRGWSAFNRVGPCAEDFEDWKVLDTFSSEAEKFIAGRAGEAKEGNPFFLYVALTSPHTPTSPHPKFQGKSAIGPYGDFVMEADDCLGRVLNALKEHGVAGNTLVIATSDHGPAPYAGPKLKATYGQIHEMEKEGHWPGGIYRGYKFSVYEGGLRVPFVVRWPGVVKKGATCERLIGLNDLMATLAEVTGTKLAGGQAPDSVSYLPLLKNAEGGATRESMLMQSTHNFVVRKGAWKLALCPGSGCRAIWGNLPKPEEAWKKALGAFGGNQPKDADLGKAPFVQLFNLASDPREKASLAAKHPEIVAELLEIARDAVARGRTTPGPDLPNDRKGIRYLPRVPK